MLVLYLGGKAVKLFSNSSLTSRFNFSHTSPHYLILFFDAKRTWQWLTRDKLEPLGVDSELDKVKLVQSKKPSEKKAVKKAYEDAILHRCRVTGENASVVSAVVLE